MATSNLSPADMKTLDQTRQRLSQLNSSLQSLLTQIHNTDPLPTWSQFTQLSSVISQNLSALSTLMSDNKALLSALAAYPLPSYPGRDQEGLLEQLLRKKLEPDIEERVFAGRAAGESVPAHATLDNPDKSGLAEASRARRAELRDLWQWAGMAANGQARIHHWGADYTREEVERGVDNVMTGLKRKLVAPDDDDDDDEEESDEEDEVAVQEGDGDDGIEMVGIRRSSVVDGQVQFDIHQKDDAGKLAPASTMSVQAQLRYMMTGK